MIAIVVGWCAARMCLCVCVGGGGVGGSNNKGWGHVGVGGWDQTKRVGVHSH